MTDEIRLELPADEDFRHIAHLVVGGLGARLDLTFEHLEDLQVGLDALLACRHGDGDVAVVVRVDGEWIRTSVGPFAAETVEELAGDGHGLGLRRVLETVSDQLDVETRDGGSWVELAMHTGAPA